MGWQRDPKADAEVKKKVLTYMMKGSGEYLQDEIKMAADGVSFSILTPILWDLESSGVIGRNRKNLLYIVDMDKAKKLTG